MPNNKNKFINTCLNKMPDSTKWCVEFGAWDGIFLSNTRELITHQDFSAVLIEANPKKYDDLQANYADHQNVNTFNCFVRYTEQENLDTILKKTEIPIEFDFLSIDVDGVDYYLWEACKRYRPRLVCIEFNHTIPAEIDFVQPADPSVQQGSSLKALVRLGKTKGYELIAVDGTDVFFVARQYLDYFGLERNDMDTLWRDRDAVTYLFSGYDGKIFLQGACKLPWHTILLHEKSFQQLPPFLRKFSADYTRGERLLFWIWLAIRHPYSLLYKFKVKKTGNEK